MAVVANSISTKPPQPTPWRSVLRSPSWWQHQWHQHRDQNKWTEAWDCLKLQVPGLSHNWWGFQARDTLQECTDNSGAIYSYKKFRADRGIVSSHLAVQGQKRAALGSARLGFGVRLSAARIPLYVICCLEHRALVWKHRQTIRLEES